MAFGSQKRSQGFASGGGVSISVTGANSSVPALAAPTAAQAAANTDAAGNTVMAPPTPISQPAFAPQPYANAVGAALPMSALSGGAGAPPSIAAISSQGIPSGSPPPPNMNAAPSALAPQTPTGVLPPAPAPVAATPASLFVGNNQIGNNSPGVSNTVAKRGGRQGMAGGGIPTSEAMDPWYTRAEERGMMQPEGLIHSPSAGRTDVHSIQVPAGSYVMPADVVSGLGEGSTMAGANVIDAMMHSNPYGIQGGQHHGSMGPPHIAPPPVPREPAFNENALSQPVKRGGTIKRAKGGGTQQPKQGNGEPVPIIVAGGEHIIYPQTIVKKFGDLNKGHKILDTFVLRARKQTIKDMQGLKGPKR